MSSIYTFAYLLPLQHTKGQYFNEYVNIVITVKMYRFVMMSTSLFTTLELHHIKPNK